MYPIPLQKRGNGVAQSELEQAEEFNGQFTDVFNKKNENSQIPSLMDDIAVSTNGVTKLLKCLNPSKALRPDELAAELGQVFQKSINSGEIPKK